MSKKKEKPYFQKVLIIFLRNSHEIYGRDLNQKKKTLNRVEKQCK